MANPRQVEWGSAPILLRATHKAGKIRIIARPTFEGTYAPAADTLEIESVAYDMKMCHKETGSHATSYASSRQREATSQEGMTEEERRKALEEVEKQQQDFGIQN